MKIVFVGAGSTTVFAAEALIEEGHEVVIIDEDEERIEELSERLDCSFLHGDGSKPDILREAGPKDSSVLFCLRDNDQDNILASLIGRHLGYGRIVTKVGDLELETVCRELGLEDVIVPDRTQSRALVGMVKGMGAVELSTLMKNEASLFPFTAKEDLGPASQLDLPDRTRALWIYRKDGFLFVDQDTEILEGDEVVLLTHEDHLGELEDRWEPEDGSE